MVSVPINDAPARSSSTISGRYWGVLTFFGSSNSSHPTIRPEANPPRCPPTEMEDTVNVRTKLSNKTIPKPLLQMEYPLDRWATVAKPNRPKIAPLAPTVRPFGVHNIAPKDPAVTAAK